MSAVLYEFPQPAVQLPWVAIPRVAGPVVESQQAIYRRRRVVVLAVAMVFFAAVGAGLKAGVEAVFASSQPTLVASISGVQPSAVVVQPGDTLWSIVSSVHPNGDVRSIVAKMQASGQSAALQVGDTVLVPS